MSIELETIATALQLTDERPICASCAGRIPDDMGPETDPDGESICEGCYDEHCHTCHGCDRIIWCDNGQTGPDDELYCNGCASFTECTRCGDPEWDDDTTCTNELNGESGCICQSCYEDDYFTCDECGDTLRHAYYGRDGMCEDCTGPDDGDDDDNNSVIRDYGDKSADRLGFFGKPNDKIYFGVELEVECVDGGRNELARDVQDTLGREFAVLKHDGSLTNGFEIVTAPATVEEHTSRFKALLQTSMTRGLRSWDTTTCGMHVHASRGPLSDLTIGKILVFINDEPSRKLVHSVAGRSNAYYCKMSRKSVSDAHKSNRHKCSDRYSAVNMIGSKTIEFRIFKGTLRYESFLKNIEFVQSVITFCRSAGIRELTVKHYLDHVLARKKDHPNLVSHLRSAGFLPPSRRPAKETANVFDHR